MKYIKGLIFLWLSCAISVLVYGSLPPLESHEVCPGSNSAVMDFEFSQGGINEEVTFSFYNSNPDVPVVSLVIKESERIIHNTEENGIRHSHRTFHLSKTLTFFPQALGNLKRAPFSFEFVDSNGMEDRFEGQNTHPQKNVPVQVKAIWNSGSLWIGIYQENKKPQVIDITDFALKRGIELKHAPSISRVDIQSGEPGMVISFGHEYKYEESIKLNAPEMLVSMMTEKYPLPDDYHQPTLEDIGKTMLERSRQLKEDGFTPVYLVTPYVGAHNTLPIFDQVKDIFRWDTTSQQADRIYDLAVSARFGLLRAWEPIVSIHTETGELKRRDHHYSLKQVIHIRPKNQNIDVSWAMGIMMREQSRFTHYMCEYRFNRHPDCIYYGSSEELFFSVDQRVIMFGRNEKKELKAYVGKNHVDVMDLSERFKTIKDVDLLEFSLDVR